jgi:hypothetical protein
VFVAAWVVRSLIVTGDAVLNENFRAVLLTPPRVVQATAGNGFEMSLLQINESIPLSDRVVVVWIDPPNSSYVYFWSTYWLYPRKVIVVPTLDPSRLTGSDALVDVRLPEDPEPSIPGFDRVRVYSYSDHVITLYRHAG